MPERTSAAPKGRTTVVPQCVTDGTGAFPDFVARAFAGEEMGRVRTEDGAIGHGETRAGDTVVPAFDRRPDRPALPSPLTVFVADADRACARAVEAGGRVIRRERNPARPPGRRTAALARFFPCRRRPA